MVKKRIVALFLSVSMLLALALNVSAADISDIEGHWCQVKIEQWVADGIINGYPDGTFRPNANITRTEFIKLVNGIFGFTAAGENAFNDVTDVDWFYQDICIASQQGYISGYEDGTMRPNAQITRQEAAKIITEILQLQQDTAPTASYLDETNMDSWAKGYIGAVIKAEIMSGYSSGELAGTFGGRRNITRAECVEALWKADSYGGTTPVVPDPTPVDPDPVAPEIPEIVFDEENGSISRVAQDIVLSNTYLGISYNVPKGWWLYTDMDIQLSADPDATANRSSLNLTSDQGVMFGTVIETANTGDSSADDYVVVSFDVEYFPGFSGAADLAAYAEDYAKQLTSPEYDGWDLKKTETVTIGGSTCIAQQFISPENDSYYEYAISMFTFALNDGFYLNVFCYYESDYPEAHTIAQAHLNDNLVLTVTE